MPIINPNNALAPGKIAESKWRPNSVAITPGCKLYTFIPSILASVIEREQIKIMIRIMITQKNTILEPSDENVFPS